MIVVTETSSPFKPHGGCKSRDLLRLVQKDFEAGNDSKASGEMLGLRPDPERE